MKEAGYVYILTNPSFKEDWVKIGKTSLSVEQRVKQLDTTAVPLPFEIYATMKTSKFNEAEKLIHDFISTFTNLRIREKREFFNIKPEKALEILKRVAKVIDDAEVDEVFKRVVIGDMTPKSSQVQYESRDETNSWILPANQKFFDVDGCLAKYGKVYWTQNNKLQKGDTVYLYSSSPDSCIKYKLLVENHNVKYNAEFDKELEFYVDGNDFEVAKTHNRFAILTLISTSRSNKMSLVHLMENGLNFAPRGGINLSNQKSSKLLQYIEDNF